MLTPEVEHRVVRELHRRRENVGVCAQIKNTVKKSNPETVIYKKKRELGIADFRSSRVYILRCGTNTVNPDRHFLVTVKIIFKVQYSLKELQSDTERRHYLRLSNIYIIFVDLQAEAVCLTRLLERRDLLTATHISARGDQFKPQ